MNEAFTEEAGKPAVAKPQHVNLGLAIDLQNSDGSRQLLVPNIKGAETMDFRQFWTAYQDIVRKARVRQACRHRLRRKHDVEPHQPGHDRAPRALRCPGLAQGQGCIIGIGSLEYPAAFQGASEETLARLAVSKQVTLHLHVRPPDHPGRAVRGVPAADPRAAARRGRVLRHDLREPAHPVRAGPLDPGLLRRPRGRRSPGPPGCRR